MCTCTIYKYWFDMESSLNFSFFNIINLIDKGAIKKTVNAVTIKGNVCMIWAWLTCGSNSMCVIVNVKSEKLTSP